jgi:hypothetical protein
VPFQNGLAAPAPVSAIMWPLPLVVLLLLLLLEA